MMSANYPQMRVFNEPERAWFAERKMDAEIEKRICASEFVSGEHPDCLSAFQSLSAYAGLRSIVLARSVAADPHVRNILEQNGYIHESAADGMLVYWK